MPNQNDYIEDSNREISLQSKYQKQMQCLTNNKLCSSCDGIDVIGEKCRYYKSNTIENKKGR